MTESGTDTNPKQGDSDFVELITASNPMTAEMLHSMLQAAGIPAYVDGRYLQDEWAMAQQALGRKGVRIEVPREHFEAAKELLEEARRAGEEMDVEGGDSEAE